MTSTPKQQTVMPITVRGPGACDQAVETASTGWSLAHAARPVPAIICGCLCLVAFDRKRGARGDHSASPEPAWRYVDPSEFVAPIAANRSARILVVTDPADQTSPVEWQMIFVRKLRHPGREVDQFFVQALDDHRHDVSGYSLLAVSECLRGSPTPEITRKLAAYVQTMLARAAQAKAGQ
jgi:hypothetical protein